MVPSDLVYRVDQGTDLGSVCRVLISQEGQVDRVDQVVQDRQADPLARSLDDQGFLFLPWVLEYQEILGGLHRLSSTSVILEHLALLDNLEPPGPQVPLEVHQSLDHPVDLSLTLHFCQCM